MIFHSNFYHTWQCFITSCWQEKVGFWATGWAHPSSMTIFVHLFIRSVIQRVTKVALNTIWHWISNFKTLFISITMLCGTKKYSKKIFSAFKLGMGNIMKYFQSHKTLLWIWIMLCWCNSLGKLGCHECYS